jgi:hypothetical protein
MRSLVFIRGAMGLGFNSECVADHLTTYPRSDKSKLANDDS